MVLTLYVVRHGQTDHNLNHIIQGHLDTELNETGRTQAEACGRRLASVRFDRASMSDLKRARDTARAIMAQQPRPRIPLDEDKQLRERDMGELSGFHGVIPRPMPSSVEPSGHFMKRTMDWFKGAVVPLASEERDLTVLAVSHGAYIITLFRMLAAPTKEGGLGYTLADSAGPLNHCANTSIAVVTIKNGHGTIERFNDQSHLSVAPDTLNLADAAPRFDVH